MPDKLRQAQSSTNLKQDFAQNSQKISSHRMKLRHPTVRPLDPRRVEARSVLAVSTIFVALLQMALPRMLENPWKRHPTTHPWAPSRSNLSLVSPTSRHATAGDWPGLFRLDAHPTDSYTNLNRILEFAGIPFWIRSTSLVCATGRVLPRH